MQLPKALATQSVGEKACPNPLLSIGASLWITDPDLKWVDAVLSPPW